LLTRFKTVKPAPLASLTESGFMIDGVENEVITFRIGRLQAGHPFNSGALTGRRRVNFPPHAAHDPSQSSYS
jgi:hypothetical protein